VSANRTFVELLAIETVTNAEADDFLRDAFALGFQARELGLPLRERAQILGYGDVPHCATDWVAGYGET
jgi:hypothetical protein